MKRTKKSKETFVLIQAGADDGLIKGMTQGIKRYKHFRDVGVIGCGKWLSEEREEWRVFCIGPLDKEIVSFVK